MKKQIIRKTRGEEKLKHSGICLHSVFISRVTIGVSPRNSCPAYIFSETNIILAFLYMLNIDASETCNRIWIGLVAVTICCFLNSFLCIINRFSLSAPFNNENDLKKRRNSWQHIAQRISHFAQFLIVKQSSNNTWSETLFTADNELSRISYEVRATLLCKFI